MTIIQAIKTIIQQNKQLAELLANSVGGNEYDDTEIKNKLTEINATLNTVDTAIIELNRGQNAIVSDMTRNTENIATIKSPHDAFFSGYNSSTIRNKNTLSLIRSIICPNTTDESISDTKANLNKLGNGYNSLYNIAYTLYRFLNDVDVADTTINRWKEIENFLQGITDTDTLTGLLEELRINILNEVETNNSTLNEAINSKTSDLFIAYSYDTLVEDELNDVVLKDQDGNVYESAELYELLEKYHNREIANLTLKADGDTGYVVRNPIVYKHTNFYQIIYSSLYVHNGIVTGQLHYDIVIYQDRFKMVYKKVNYING